MNTGRHHPICRRKAAAKADREATTKDDWQRVFDEELARLTQQAEQAAQDRRQGIQRKPKRWTYHGDTSTYKKPVCELGHIARQNGDKIA